MCTRQTLLHKCNILVYLIYGCYIEDKLFTSALSGLSCIAGELLRFSVLGNAWEGSLYYWQNEEVNCHRGKLINLSVAVADQSRWVKYAAWIATLQTQNIRIQRYLFTWINMQEERTCRGCSVNYSDLTPLLYWSPHLNMCTFVCYYDNWIHCKVTICYVYCISVQALANVIKCWVKEQIDFCKNMST